MKEILEKKLCDKYPQLLTDATDPNSVSLARYGFSHGDGWYDIVEEVFRRIMETNPSEEFHFVQIKEKFGTLRMYHTSCTADIHSIVEAAELKSSKTCEICGAPGELNTRTSWFSTLCNSCSEQ